jgi:hypothetical protein
VTVPTIEADPGCTGANDTDTPAMAAPSVEEPRRLRAERRAFDSIPRETWDRLAAGNPWATPFSGWAFHRAWWDAYGANAHEQTIVIVDDGAAVDARPEGDADPTPDAQLLAIVPLMHRHEVEPTDAATHTTLRHTVPAPVTPVPPTAKAIFFGASYHGDYATILGRPVDFPAVAHALVDHLCDVDQGDPDHPAAWDVIDLRRLRCGDPATEALAAAFGAQEVGEGWTLNLEREDVCPVAPLPAEGDIDAYLATLGKKERHEIRRKVRRAEAAGAVELLESAEPLADLDAFIDLHQARWGADGLFPPTAGGAQSRLFLQRLFELSAADGTLHLGFLTVAGRRVAAEIHFETPDAYLYYNAGVDPAARDLSPGVVMVERLARRAIAAGKLRLDFLRGHEPYKYEWGGVDEPLQRLLVRRSVA